MTLSRLARGAWIAGALLAALVILTGNATVPAGIVYAVAYAGWFYSGGAAWRRLRAPREPAGPRLVK